MNTIKVVCAVIVDNNRILSTARGYGEYKGWWEFPGGKVEEGETSQEALIREIKEELDAEISIIKFICNVEYDYPTFHLDMDCYLCRLVTKCIRLVEAEDAKWLSVDELNGVEWLPADKMILKELQFVEN